MSKCLRIGLLLDSFEVPAWVAVALREIAESDHSQIVVVVLNDAANGPAQPAGWGGRLRSFARRAFEMFDKLVDRRIPPDQDAFARRDLRRLLADVPMHRVAPDQKRYSDYFSADDVAKLRALNINVFLRFGFRILRGDILNVARCGVWSFHHGDNRVNRGGPAGFWEVHENWPKTGATLQILTEDIDGGRVLARTSSTTLRTSVNRNRNALYWKAVPLLPRALARLHREGEAAFRSHIDAANAAPAFYSNRLFVLPSSSDLLGHAILRVGREISLVARRLLTRQQWFLLYGFADDLVTACWRLRPLLPPLDRFWADPHVVQVGGRYFVFIEEFMFATDKGHIAVLEFDSKGVCGPARKVLEQPYHLSYPFVLEHGGDYFMVPESAANRTVDLYRATSFPNRWEFVEHLLTDTYAVDATLLYENGRWWLFANITEHKGAYSGELFLFSSQRLSGGDWRPHPNNPLSSDVGNSRPAGAILRRNGRLYRPAQDGSGNYGRAIKLNEILELSQTEYRERKVTSIEPNWDRRLLKTHTLTHAGRLTVLDALRPRWKWERGS